jgi:hypothetical protein
MDESPLTRSQVVFYAAIICLSLALIGAIVIPNLLTAREGSHNFCISNLRIIDGAKQQWALENHKTNSDIPTWADIKDYIGRHGAELPKCPSGGTYTLGAISNRPTCSIPGHVLP